jgi:IS5 family transposase
LACACWVIDETTILNFRHLLEKHQLTEKVFAEVNAYLAARGVTLRLGTLVDATIIDAPSSTKNEAKARDSEMSSTKNGNNWYFGMQAHVGVDADSGVTPKACLWHDVHSLETATAKTNDSQVWDELLHGKETSVWADKGYLHSAREAAFTKDSDGFWGVMRKAPRGGELDELNNRIIGSVRAKVEHPFRILERQFGHVKTRYRGLAKNRAHLFTLFALGNLFLMRRRLAA